MGANGNYAGRSMTRRTVLSLPALPLARAATDSIDRKAVVTRHNPIFRALDARAPVSVGNGEFAFTADFTGRHCRHQASGRASGACAGSRGDSPVLRSTSMARKAEEVVSEGRTFGIIGAGVMGQTLAKGLLASGLIERDRLWAGDKNGATCEAARHALHIPVETGFAKRVPTADLILICVKPADAGGVAGELVAAGLPPDTLVISILAGVSTEKLESLLGTRNPVVRAMPNTPAIVGQGMTVVCGGKHSSGHDIARAQRIFEAVGKCLALDEKHFDAVTALSGSGPGYLFLIMEALADAGVRVGLPRQVALTLVSQTVLGAATMVSTTKRHPAALRDDVTTPAGCTIGGILVLEDGRVRSVLARAVEEATKIAAGLGGTAKH
jgi:pyrroline-5-carboxylate reductase